VLPQRPQNGAGPVDGGLANEWSQTWQNQLNIVTPFGVLLISRLSLGRGGSEMKPGVGASMYALLELEWSFARYLPPFRQTYLPQRLPSRFQFQPQMIFVGGRVRHQATISHSCRGMDL
jgi:hypothetical protein